MEIAAFSRVAGPFSAHTEGLAQPGKRTLAEAALYSLCAFHTETFCKLARTGIA